MGASVLFPKFLRKLQCIGRSHKKQNRCPMPHLEYIQACTHSSVLRLGNISGNFQGLGKIGNFWIFFCSKARWDEGDRPLNDLNH